jgi:predicted alpha/beta-fold hydrolase
MSQHAPYRAPWWLPGRHLQTIYPYLALRPAAPHYRRERVDTPDGDFVDLDWIDANGDVPTVVLFHGLEGCSRSHYASALMHAVAAKRWRGVVAHFRGCSGEPNRLARAYHSGDADEIDWILQLMHARCAGPVFAIGVSLGGNALLKWLAREHSGAGKLLCAASAVSAPMNLMVAGHRLGQGFGRLYGLHFLRSLKPKAIAKLARHPHLAQPRQVRKAFSLRAFDDAFTAPVHGFRDVTDYWTRASSIGEIDRIDLPTLIVHARNDPFLPGHYLPRTSSSNACLHFDFTRQGGHVGFVSGRFPGNLSWLPERVLGFFQTHLPDALPDPDQHQTFQP